jgi:hypothetical protein
LENLNNDDVDINRTWESIRYNTKVSATESADCYELKQHKQWFGAECSKLHVLEQRKQAKLQ